MNENQLEKLLNSYKDVNPQSLTRQKWKAELLEEKQRSLQIKKRMWLLGLSTSFMGFGIGILLMLPVSTESNINESFQESTIEYVIFR